MKDAKSKETVNQIIKEIIQRNPKLHYNCRHFKKGVNEMYERDKNDKIKDSIKVFYSNKHS